MLSYYNYYVLLQLLLLLLLLLLLKLLLFLLTITDNYIVIVITIFISISSITDTQAYFVCLWRPYEFYKQFLTRRKERNTLAPIADSLQFPSSSTASKTLTITIMPSKRFHLFVKYRLGPYDINLQIISIRKIPVNTFFEKERLQMFTTSLFVNGNAPDKIIILLE